MLSKLKLEELGGGINLLDIGASGKLSAQWNPIQRIINLYAFEPNAEECKRLGSSSHQLKSAVYLPYAISNRNGQAILYKTRSMYCSSLLRPDEEYVRRFEHGGLFEIVGQENVQTFRLDAVRELDGVDVDAIKTDSQGLDMQILAGSGSMLDQAFFVETEPGFSGSYVGEDTYSQVDSFMRSKGFALFDMNIHRVSRSNKFASHHRGKEQIKWCEATWLKDYIDLQRQNRLPELTREKALKSLVICNLLKQLDFGYELAMFFHSKKLILTHELKALGQARTWDITRDSILTKTVDLSFRMLPGKVKKYLAIQLQKTVGQPNLLKFVGKSATKMLRSP